MKSFRKQKKEFAGRFTLSSRTSCASESLEGDVVDKGGVDRVLEAAADGKDMGEGRMIVSCFIYNQDSDVDEWGDKILRRK